MTCIVALKQDNKIIFGSDSLTSDTEGDFVSITKQSKICRKQDKLMGFCGLVRPAQVIQSGWTFPKKENSDEDFYLRIKIPSSIRTSLKSSGCLSKDDDSTESVDIEVLFTYNNKIYYMDSAFGIHESINNYFSIGSGAGYALGSLFSTKKVEMTAKERIKCALDAASHFSASVGPPFKYLEVETS